MRLSVGDLVFGDTLLHLPGRLKALAVGYSKSVSYQNCCLYM